MSTFVNLFLAVVFVAATLDSSQACSCAFTHPQDSFCRKDSLSFSFKIISESYVDTQGSDDITLPNPSNSGPGFGFAVKRRYTVQNFYLYRGNNDVTPSTTIDYIYTSTSSASCGVNLQLNKRYVVIGGYYFNGRLDIASCNHITLFPTQFAKRIIMLINLHYRYPRSCKTCEVVNCRFGGDCTVPRKPNQCYTNALPEALKIDSEFQSICYRQSYYKGCQWLNGFKRVTPVILPPPPVLPIIPN